MDSIGIHIAERIDTDSRVEVRLKSGKNVRLQAVDAREAVESRNGVIVGSVLRKLFPEARKLSAELTEEEIVSNLEAAQTTPEPMPTSHPAMRPQRSQAIQSERARAVTRSAEAPKE